MNLSLISSKYGDAILFACYKDECSFVSLRDVARLLDVANWFYKHREDLFAGMDRQEKSGTPPEPNVQRVVSN